MTNRPELRGRPAKREAIVAAAREVFLREGYARTSMDAISEAASVSKRTVYNHFPDKRALFIAVIEDTVAPVLDEFVAMLDRHLPAGRETELREALIGFCRDWVQTSVLFPDHAALLRLVIAEASHLPEVIDVWRAAGAAPSQHALVKRLEDLAGQEELAIADAPAAARRLTALVCSPAQSRSFFGLLDIDDAEVDALVTDGVDAFLALYR